MLNKDSSEVQNRFNGVNVLRIITGKREFAVSIFVVIIFVLLTFTTDTFFAINNFKSILSSLSLEAIIAVGMMVVMVGGGFDLSVGSTMAFSGMVLNMCLLLGLGIPLSIIFALLAGCLVGVINGLLVAKLKINPFIATLGTMGIFRGLAMVISNRYSSFQTPQFFSDLGSLKLLGLGINIWLMIFIVIVFDILMRKNSIFRQFYYVGGNPESARISGINVDRVKMSSYIIVGFFSSIVGVLTVARMHLALPTVGANTNLDVVTAVIIGGASLFGGQGTIIGGVLGILLMNLIRVGLVLLHIDAEWQRLIIGAILIVAVAVDVISKKQKI